MNNGFYMADAIEIIEEVLASGGEFRLYHRGTSMLPLLVEGRDSVVLRRDISRRTRKNDILLYRRDDGQFVLHRAMKIAKDGTYTMCGDNQLILEPGIRDDQLIGYVSGVYKGERLVKNNALRYRLYVMFWCCMPIRRSWRFMLRATQKVKRSFLGIFRKNG